MTLPYLDVAVIIEIITAISVAEVPKIPTALLLKVQTSLFEADHSYMGL